MSDRTFYQKLVETRGLPNPQAAFILGSEAAVSFLEKHELPIEDYRPINPRNIHFNHYRIYWKDGVKRTVLTKVAPTFIKEEVIEPVDNMDPLTILLLKEEGMLVDEQDNADDGLEIDCPKCWAMMETCPDCLLAMGICPVYYKSGHFCLESDPDELELKPYNEDEPGRQLTLSEWLSMMRYSEEDLKLQFTNAEEELLAQLSDVAPSKKSEPLRKPRSAYRSRRRR